MIVKTVTRMTEGRTSGSLICHVIAQTDAPSTRAASYSSEGMAFSAAMRITMRSEEHTSELQSLMRISYAVFCLKKKKSEVKQQHTKTYDTSHILRIS